MKKIFLLIMLYFFNHAACAKLPYYPIQFPRDEAAHFKNVPYTVNNLTEWWYYNGKLISKEGRQFGYYISYFYMQNDLDGKRILTPQFVMQLVDLDKQKTYAYGVFSDPNQSQFGTDKLNVKLGPSLSLVKVGDDYLLKGKVKSRQGPVIEFALQLTPDRQPLLANKKGLIDMWDGSNSFYYSLTHLKTSGNLKIGNQSFTLEPQKSLSWMDHQWGDFIITPSVNQWLYANVQLENGLELNLGMSFDPDNKQITPQQMSIRLPDGKTIFTRNFQYVPHFEAGQKFPLSYDLIIPEINLKLKLKALSSKQAENTVWEGVSKAEGSYQGSAVQGQAFTENTVLDV